MSELSNGDKKHTSKSRETIPLSLKKLVDDQTCIFPDTYILIS
jgi:hypothetical protein